MTSHDTHMTPTSKEASALSLKVLEVLVLPVVPSTTVKWILRVGVVRGIADELNLNDTVRLSCVGGGSH